jgi:hypothetical protein
VRVRSGGSRAGGGAARGFALPAALFVLLVVAALAAGGSFAALQELRAGRNSRLAESAFDAAEAGLGRALAAGRSGEWGPLAPGDSLVVSETLPGGTGRYVVSVRRLNGRLFLLESTGADGSGDSRRALALLVRRDRFEGRFAAALSVAGGVEIGTGSSLDGRDTDPPGWGACAGVARDTVAGLAVPPGAAVQADSACEGGGCLAGEPPVLRDSALVDSSVRRLGGVGWTELERMAVKVYPATAGGVVVTPSPAGTEAECDRSAADNWGEPGRPAAVPSCQAYFPVILVRGDLTLAAGRGQGVLLVEGDLTVTGGAEFDGAVLVGGSLRGSGAGGRFLGWITVAGLGGGLPARLAGTSVAFSSCALAPALAEIGPLRPLRERAWAYLY